MVRAGGRVECGGPKLRRRAIMSSRLNGAEPLRPHCACLPCLSRSASPFSWHHAGANLANGYLMRPSSSLIELTMYEFEETQAHASYPIRNSKVRLHLSFGPPCLRRCSQPTYLSAHSSLSLRLPPAAGSPHTILHPVLMPRNFLCSVFSGFSPSLPATQRVGPASTHTHHPHSPLPG